MESVAEPKRLMRNRTAFHLLDGFPPGLPINT